MARFAIVGAGMVGAACAAELAAEADVVVIDGSRPGGGATAACMGHVVVMDDSPAQLALTASSRRLWDTLELPPAAERERCGTLWVASDGDELAAARDKLSLYAAHGVEAELLDGDALGEAEPELRRGLAGGLRVPGDSVVYPTAAVLHLLATAARRAASAGRRFERRDGLSVRSLRPARAGAVLELAGGGRLEVDAVVVAAGLASLELLPVELRRGLAIRPRKGHLVISERCAGFCRHQLVELGYLRSAHGGAGETSVAFNLQPRRTGQVLVGSSRQSGVRDLAIEPAIVGRMLRRATHFLPRLGALPATRVWTGLRPATDDHLPYVGPLVGAPSIHLAAGHEGLGITTATGTAHLIAHHLAGRAVELDPVPYLPSRAAPPRA